MQSYKHFTQAERACLQIMSKAGKSLRDIAKEVNKSPSSLSRELRRNTNKNNSYDANLAHIYYCQRRKKCIRKNRITTDKKLKIFIQKKLQILWSPEIIVQKWKKRDVTTKLSVTTVYRAVYNGLIFSCTAKTHLRRRGKKKYGKRSKYNTIKPTHTIHDRPSYINNRERIGDWEGDTMNGLRGKGALISLVDRKTRYLRLQTVKNKSAIETEYAISSAMQGLPAYSLTVDNGSEFANFQQIEKNVGLRVYFADPRSPWQRGSNENINDAVRFFFSRKTDFTTLSALEVQKVEDLINNRPRKCLNWLSPFQAFHEKRCA